ncbi:TauD/TfdA family dioxygenase [Streptomyces mobaraensis]|uniref:TauD/TfdA family dioxygenase n=1 Tax=Streptomyces mobaraensis TaxID=35621 RepID=UPI00332B68E1
MTLSAEVRPSVGLFTQYEADIQQPQAIPLITARMRHTGLVAISGLTSPETVAEFADIVMHRNIYPGQGPLALHEIRHTSEHAHRLGHTELTRAAVELHTCRAELVVPPRLVLLACLHPGDAGGEIVLVDGKVVFGDLCSRRPDAAYAFVQQRAATFGRLAFPVFDQVGSRQHVLRLRQDGAVRWNAGVQPFLPVLRTALLRHQQILRLGPGQGLLVDNARWATGRRSFTGPRRFLRAEGTPREPLGAGFVSGAVPS